jgi:hypothetical protein
MISVQFLQRFAVCFILSVFLNPGEFNTQAAFEEQSRMSLSRDLAYEGVASIDTRYIVTSFLGMNFSTCVHNCLVYSPQCAALLYSKTLLNCILLKCHLNDKLTTNSTKGGDWEYWRNYQGNCLLSTFYACSNLCKSLKTLLWLKKKIQKLFSYMQRWLYRSGSYLLYIHVV